MILVYLWLFMTSHYLADRITWLSEAFPSTFKSGNLLVESLKKTGWFEKLSDLRNNYVREP